MSTTMACQPEQQRAIESQLQGTLAPERWVVLRAHVAGCPACRQTYNRLAYAERLLQGGPAAMGTPSPESLARIERAVLADAAPQRATVGWRDALVRWFRSPARLVPTLAGAAAVVVAIVWLPRAWDGAGSDPSRMDDPTAAIDPQGFQPRGALPSTQRAAAIRVFCLVDGAVRAVGATGDASALPCPLAGRLRFTASNAGGYRHVFVVGVDSARAVKWYAPKPPEHRSVAAPAASAGEVPLGRPLRLQVNHDAGELRVYALFSDEPLEASAVERAIAALPAGALPASLPLAVTDVHQTSVHARIRP